MRMSRLSLIDLAGSERATSQSERRVEGSFINKSLLTLEKVIAALTEDKPRCAAAAMALVTISEHDRAGRTSLIATASLPSSSNHPCPAKRALPSSAP